MLRKSIIKQYLLRFGLNAKLIALHIRIAQRFNLLGTARDLLNYGLVMFPRNLELIEVSHSSTSPEESLSEAGNKGSFNSACILLSHLRQVYRFESVVDIGAGAGSWLRAAAARGARTFCAIDRMPMSSDLPQGTRYVAHDLASRFAFNERFDLAICVEVAEHLPPARSQTFIDDICKLSDVVVFGAALPRQLGDGHINCRLHKFWIDEFNRHDFYCYDYFRPAIWYNPSVEAWYRQNTYLFVKRQQLASFPEMRPPSLTSVYHPCMIFDFNRKYVVQDCCSGPLSSGTSGVSSNFNDY